MNTTLALITPAHEFISVHILEARPVIASLLIISTILASAIVMAEGIDVVERVMWRSDYLDVPADMAIYNGYIYVAAFRTEKPYRIILYKVDDSGRLVWRVSWDPPGDVFATPIRVFAGSKSIIVPVLYENRSRLTILCYDTNGGLIFSRDISLPDVIKIFDVALYPDGTMILAGSRYVAGKRYEFYASRIDIVGGRIYWERVWGSKDIDVVTHAIIVSGKWILLCGNSTVYNTVLILLSPHGTIVWNRSISPCRILSLKDFDGAPKALIYVNGSYGILDIDLATGDYCIKTINTTIEGVGLPRLRDFHESGDVLVLVGSCEREGSGLDGVIELFYKGSMEKIMWASTSRPDGYLKTTIINDTIYSLGLSAYRPFITMYSIVYGGGGWLCIVIPITVAAIVAVSIIIYIRILRRRVR